MEHTADESQNALFVYFQEDMSRFWVYDGRQYLHFSWRETGARFVRAQAFLPANTLGICVPMTAAQRQVLEAEAAHRGLRLPFFDSEEACNQFALASQQDQFIFDRTLPGGYFYLDDDSKRRRDDEE